MEKKNCYLAYRDVYFMMQGNTEDGIAAWWDIAQWGVQTCTVAISLI